MDTATPTATIVPVVASILNEREGLTIEHIMLSITVVSNKESAGQFDDSAAHLVARELKLYHGVQSVNAEVLYRHTKIENHSHCCQCHFCEPNKTNLCQIQS